MWYKPRQLAEITGKGLVSRFPILLGDSIVLERALAVLTRAGTVHVALRRKDLARLLHLHHEQPDILVYCTSAEHQKLFRSLRIKFKRFRICYIPLPARTVHRPEKTGVDAVAGTRYRHQPEKKKWGIRVSPQRANL